MRICELKDKEVINCKTCERLGYPCDIEFCSKSGCVQSLIVPGPCKLFGILCRDKDYVIPWNCICQIGPDIILVDICPENCLKNLTDSP